MHDSAQRACDGRAALFGWPAGSLIYYNNTEYTGECFLPGSSAMGYVYGGYYCPQGYQLQGAVNVDVAHFGTSAVGNGPSLTCGCSAEGWRFFDDVQPCLPVTQDPTPQFNHPKANGGSCPACGNPINPATGGKVQIEVDYAAAGPGGLRLQRTFNGDPRNLDSGVARSMGTRWTQTHDISVAHTELPQKIQIDSTCWRRTDIDYRWCEPVWQSLWGRKPVIASLVRPDGKVFFFRGSIEGWGKDKDVNGLFKPAYDANEEILGFSFTDTGGTIEKFDTFGKVISVTASNGQAQRYTYSDGVTNDSSQGRYPADAPVCSHIQAGPVLPAGLKLCVTDHWGKQLQFEYSPKGLITKAIDLAGGSYLYEYDGESGGCVASAPASLPCTAKNLTKVTYPDGKFKTYHYNEAANINNGQVCAGAVTTATRGHLISSLTGITDENGVRYASWDYDCQGRATVSQHAGGAEKVSLSYGAINSSGEYTTTATYYAGDPASPTTSTVPFRFIAMNGVGKNVGIDQPCATCGPTKSTDYDVNGNPATTVDRNNMVTTFAYNLARNVETRRTEAVGTAQERMTSTEWHPSRQLPVRIAGPKSLATFAYYDNGLIKSRSEQATTDADGKQAFTATTVGSARTVSYTYNANWQLETVTGPNPGNKVTYAYDPGTGQLLTITNALGHFTRFEDYDAHGRVRKITQPNGVVTRITYHVRGWPETMTVTDGVRSLTTSYEYDGVGQVKKMIAPGGVIVSNVYDDARRLTDVYDNLGNNIHYERDLMGNATKETVKDPSGALTRQLSRQFDALNRLKEQTGAAQ